MPFSQDSRNEVSSKVPAKVMDKPEGDQIWISRPYRSLSHPVSRLVIRVGISSNQVTFASCMAAVAASFVLLQLSMASLIISVVCIHVFVLLDHVDGAVARYERHSDPARVNDRSGMYFDHLVHFFQGPSFYSCLGVGLTLHDGSVVWALAGIIGAVSTSAFPWLLAHQTALGLAVSGGERALEIAKESIVPHVYRACNVREEFFIVPRSIAEAKWLAKQAFGFPNSLFIFSTMAVLDVVVPMRVDYLFVKLFLVCISAMKLIAAIESTRRYLRVFSKI